MTVYWEMTELLLCFIIQKLMYLIQLQTVKYSIVDSY